MKKSLLAAVLVAAATMGLAFGADKGKTVQFGRYYEDKAGKKLTPIEWTVLDEKDGRTLLITTKVIDAQPFHNKRIAVTWGNFSLRHHHVDDPIIGDRPAIWVDSAYLKK